MIPRPIPQYLQTKDLVRQRHESIRCGTVMLKNCLFGTYRAPATKIFFHFSNIHEPRNHPN
jgi:hypothetical protein